MNKPAFCGMCAKNFVNRQAYYKHKWKMHDGTERCMSEDELFEDNWCLHNKLWEPPRKQEQVWKWGATKRPVRGEPRPRESNVREDHNSEENIPYGGDDDNVDYEGLERALGL